MNDVELMLPGEFGAATRLSPKALRLYAEQGLLVPVRVDPGTGYRRYHRDQVSRGRLIGRLRGLGLSLARVATLLPLDPPARQAELRAWLAAQEEQLRRRRELVEALADADRPVAGTPMLRARPERKLLCREQRTHVDGLSDFVADTEQRIRARLRAAGLSSDGPTLVYFHGLVTRDSDGPVEVAIAFTGSVEPDGDLRVRLSPAGTDVFLPVAGVDADFPDVLRAYDAVEVWLDAQRLTCVGSPVEIWPGTGGAAVDVTYPVATG
ncbi:MerR family transcriptional regulator [Plantactinospora sonchi]|uniref:MerR family transcriptional regulator n=1 Tax=Plantactinospora sonchi TaxID=1544735 RepID=A0ABU7RY21_9ACTN